MIFGKTKCKEEMSDKMSYKLGYNQAIGDVKDLILKYTPTKKGKKDILLAFETIEMVLKK